MAEVSVISPVMFNLYKDCDLKFYYKYVEQVPTPILDENFVEGKNIHTLVAYYLRNFQVEKYLKKLSDRELMYWNNLKSSKFLNFEIVAIEHSLTMKIDDYWIGGRIDAIVKNNNDYYILDYKTGGVNSDKTYDFQTMVYLLLCDEMFKEYKNNGSLTFVYLDLKNNKEVQIKFDEKLKEEYLDRIKTACAGMEKVSLDGVKHSVCTDKNCPYSKLCMVSKY